MGAMGTRLHGTLRGHTNWIRTVQFSQDDKLGLSGSDDKCVKLWDIHTRQCIHSYKEHNGAVLCVRFHPCGNIISSCSRDHTIKSWDLRTHRRLHALTEHTNA